MQKLYLFTIVALGFILTSCSSISSPSEQRPVNLQSANIKSTELIPTNKKDPLTVAFYNNLQDIHAPYVVVGNETVPKYNSGIKRQIGNIHDNMRALAAAMGGDAVVNLKHNQQSVSATIIAYQKPRQDNSRIS